MRHFQSKWLPSGSVIQGEEPLWPGSRIQFLPPREKGRERRLYMKRARRLRDRADREGWTSSELYMAMNNGCRIGRVTVKQVSFDDALHAQRMSAARTALLRAMAAGIGGRDE